MKRVRRVFGGEFRAKVALAAVKGDKTLSEGCRRLGRARPGKGLTGLSPIQLIQTSFWSSAWGPLYLLLPHPHGAANRGIHWLASSLNL